MSTLLTTLCVVSNANTARHLVSHPQLARTLSARSIVAIAEEFPVAPTGSSSEADAHLHGTDLSGYSTPPPDLALRAQNEHDVPAPGYHALAVDTGAHENIHDGDQDSCTLDGSEQPMPYPHYNNVLPQAAPGVDSFLPSTQAVMQRMQEGSVSDSQDSQNGSRNGDHRIRRKPLPKDSPTRSIDRERGRDSGVGSSNGGAGDTPYIHFALDQLTRDEDVRGSRRYPLSAMETAVGNLERNNGPPNYGFDHHPRNFSPSAKSLGQGDESTTTIPLVPPRHPQRGFDPSNPMNRFHTNDAPLSQPNVLISFDRDMNSLRFLPKILRPTMMIVYMVLVLLMLAALCFCGVWSGVNPGLYDYTQFGGSRYFIFRYLQTICGVFLLLWLFQIQVAVQRVAPYLAMASLSLRARGQGPLMEVQPTNFILPKFFYFRSGQPVIGVCMLLFWLQIFTIPLLASVFNVYFYGDPGSGYWRWVAVQPVVWTLFGLYVLQLVALLVLTIWIRLQRTGLRWDPRSLADLIVLLDRSNIMQGYAGSEIFAKPDDFRQRLAGRTDRLGYWHSTRKTMDVFYALGEEAAPTRRYSLEQGRIREKAPERTAAPPEPQPTVLHELEDSEEYHQIRHRYLPWYLRPVSVALWSLLAILLYIAFLVVSFVNRAVLRGWAPLIRTAATDLAFSPTNFVYSFIPALIAQLLFLCWLSIDYAFRRLQPYASMSSPGDQGAPAESSLLLDYPSRLPVSITLAALVGKHYHVAWFSLVSLTTASLPILAGGCFWAQWFEPQLEVRVAADPPAFYALCALLALLAISPPLALAGLSRRRLPHANTTLAEQFSWLYQSRILGENGAGARLCSKQDVATRLMTASTPRERGFGPSGGEGRFVFGRCRGRDGRTHLGIERIGRDNYSGNDDDDEVAEAGRQALRRAANSSPEERHPRLLLNAPGPAAPLPDMAAAAATAPPYIGLEVLALPGDEPEALRPPW